MMSCVLLLLIGQLVISSVKTDPRVPVKIVSDKEVQVADVNILVSWRGHFTPDFEYDSTLYLLVESGERKYRIYVSTIQLNIDDRVIAGDVLRCWGQDAIITLLPKAERLFWIAPWYDVYGTRYVAGTGYMCCIDPWIKYRDSIRVKLPLYYDNDDKVLVVNIILKNQFKQKKEVRE